MTIVLVGGHDRMHDEYRSLGDKRGHKVKVLTQMCPRFGKVLGRPDAIIIFTSTVSHGMARTAAAEARRQGIPVVRSHTSSGSSLEDMFSLLEEWGSGSVR